MISLLIGLVSVYGFACYRLADFYLSPIRNAPTKPDSLNDVLIPTSAGENPAWITPGFGTRGDVVFIMAHGYGGNRADWVDLMTRLSEQGYESIAPAMPGQDASPDATVGFGMKEAKAIVETAKWVREQYGMQKPRIVLVGLSMGGAAAWLASEMDPTVDGVVTEGAYAEFGSTIDRWFERKLPGASYYLRPVVWIASARSGLKPSDVVPERAAEKWRGRPALVIQGEDDDLIVRTHAERLAAASEGELWMVPGATHAQCQNIAEKEYAERLTAFAARLKQ